MSFQSYSEQTPPSYCNGYICQIGPNHVLLCLKDIVYKKRPYRNSELSQLIFGHEGIILTYVFYNIC